MPMKKTQQFHKNIALLKAKALWTPVALAGCMAIASCGTLPVQKTVSDSDMDASYAVKSVEMKKEPTRQQVTKDPRAYYNYLMALKAEGDSRFEQATLHYREVVKRDPETEELHEKLAGLLLRSGQIEELLKVCRESLEKFPDNPVLNSIMADILAGREDYYGAIKHYRKVTEIDPGGSRAYLLMGNVYDSLKQYDQAEVVYRQVILTEAANPMGQHYLGLAQMRKGNFDEAKISLGKAVSLRPNFLQAREHLAWVLLKLGHTDQAIREYKLLLKLDPRNKKVRKFLEDLERNPASRNENPLASEALPDSMNDPVDIHMSIAAIYYEQAIYLKALDEFQISLIKVNRKEPHMLMSRIYELLGRVDKAIAEFEIIRKMEPKSVDVLRYTARLYSLGEQPDEAVRRISFKVFKEFSDFFTPEAGPQK